MTSTTSSGPARLSITDLHAGYGATVVLRGITLDVAPGAVTTLLGANGAGKTTLLKTVMGVVRPQRGHIGIGDDAVAGLAPPDVVRRGITLVPEGRQLFPQMTVAENLELGACHRTGRARIHADLDRVLEYFPRLRERLGQLAGTLSGGEQQMLAIGRGLMAAPRVLMLDEPSLGLAPRIVTEIFAMIHRAAREGTTVLLVEQNAYAALRISTWGFVLQQGRVVRGGRADELLDRHTVMASYIGE
jgi:branched-chain amino acid transport system ATP-binding protein